MVMSTVRRTFTTLTTCVLVVLTGCATVPRAPSTENEEAASQGLVTTQNAAVLRYSPSFSAPVIQKVPANTQLYWLGNQQRNGFYRVVSRDKGTAGWIRATDVRVAQQTVFSGFQAFAACATTLDQCDARGGRGCAAEGSPDAASNILKHHVPNSATATTLSFDDLANLQQQADNTVGTGVHIPPSDRSALSNLSVSNGTVSEGDAVRVVGYLVAEGTGPHPNSSGESVNCGLKGPDNNDFHIPVASDPSASEFEGVVVEMIPQSRPTNWTIAKLKSVQANHQQIWVE